MILNAKTIDLYQNISCRTGRMAQWVKAFVPKPEDPILGTHSTEVENRL